MVKFRKYHGLGNDFIVIDGLLEDINDLNLPKQAVIRNICDRHFGIGADGLILLLPPIDNNKIRMKIFNSDGTEAEMCGNGVRCLVKFLLDGKMINLNESIRIETLSGIVVATTMKDSSISVDMGLPSFQPSKIPTTLKTNSKGVPEGKIIIDQKELNVFAVGMGNPHMIIYIEDINEITLNNWGKVLEIDPSFPNKTNVHFVKIISNDCLEVHVWERGCGPTLACGTGACATLVVTHMLGLCGSSSKVNLPGGQLLISWPKPESSVFMQGPSQLVYSGQFKVSDFSE